MQTLEGLIAEAETWEAQDRPRKAIECYEQAVALLVDATEQPLVLKRAEIYQAVGTSWRLLGNHKLTGDYLRKALADFEFVFSGQHHEKLGEIYFVLGSFMEQLWKRDLARDYYQKAYEQLKECFGLSHVHTVKVLEKIKTIG